MGVVLLSACAATPAHPDVGAHPRVDGGTDAQLPMIDAAPIDAGNDAFAQTDAGPRSRCREVDCGSGCTSLASDPANCGTCGHACRADEVCEQFTCAPSCSSDNTGETNCARSCVHTSTDTHNCGTCGNRCADDMVCAGPFGGACVCPGNQHSCGGACVDRQNDPMFCGTCTTACAAGSFCVAGQCVTACPSDLTACGTRCVDTVSDPEHCGGCNVACGAGTCSGGVCVCNASAGMCGDDVVCSDLQYDVAHCGSCATQCPFTHYCYRGTCLTGYPP